MHVVDCWSDGIWCPTESRDVSKSQLALPLASCSVLFELWLVACHIQTDPRELSRSTGLHVPLITIWSPSLYWILLPLKAGAKVYTQIKTTVCETKYPFTVRLYYYAHRFSLAQCLSSPLHTPAPFLSTALCLASQRSAHTHWQSAVVLWKCYLHR